MQGIDLASYLNQRVEITVGDADNVNPDRLVVGTVLPTSNTIALLIKVAGRAGYDMVFVHEIVDIEIVDQPERRLRIKQIGEVPKSAIRRHLFESHGLTLSDIEKMSAETAESYHNDLHASFNGQLGHSHGRKVPTKREKAIEAASSN